jgi:hypothetical protein
MSFSKSWTLYALLRRTAPRYHTIAGGAVHTIRRREMRFVLTRAAACIANGQYRRLRAGTVVVDIAANRVAASDVVAASICASPNVGMEPLDSAAVAALAAVGISATIGEPVMVQVTGASSIDT